MSETREIEVVFRSATHNCNVTFVVSGNLGGHWIQADLFKIIKSLDADAVLPARKSGLPKVGMDCHEVGVAAIQGAFTKMYDDTDANPVIESAIVVSVKRIGKRSSNNFKVHSAC